MSRKFAQFSSSVVRERFKCLNLYVLHITHYTWHSTYNMFGMRQVRSLQLNVTFASMHYNRDVTYRCIKYLIFSLYI